RGNMRDVIWNAAKAVGDRKTVLILARWANTFNVWKWPRDFPMAKPDWWDDAPNRDRDGDRDKYRVLCPITDAIRSLIPHKDIMRDWHVRHLKRTNEEFESWWENEYLKAEESDEPVTVG